MLIKDRFLVIDISALLYLVQDNEELKYRLLSLVEFTTEDIEIKEPKEFLSLLDVVEDETLDSLIDDNERIKQLLQEVNDWEQDKKTSAEYEKFCTKVLKILFLNDLTLWRKQQKSNDDLYRFDVICKIKDDVTRVLFGNFLKNTSDLNTSYLNLRIIKMLLRKKRYIQQRNICMQKH